MTDQRFFYFDGQLLKAEPKQLNDLTPGILKAKGVFETLRIYRGVPFAFEKHYLRMVQGLHVLKIHFQISSDELHKIMMNLLSKNRLLNARIRVQIWKDRKTIHLAVFCSAITPSSKSVYKAQISKIKQNKSRYSHVKTLDYAHCRKALLEAKQMGYDEAILLNNHQAVVEGAHSNIFIVKDGTVVTPKLSHGCLNGVTRDIVKSCCRQLGLPIKERKIDLNSILNADEIFLTNSIIEVKPLVCINKTTIFHINKGAYTKKIAAQFKKFLNQYIKLKKSLKD